MAGWRSSDIQNKLKYEISNQRLSYGDFLLEIKVYNTTGQLVSQSIPHNPILNMEIDMHNDVTGVYYVKIFLDNGEILTRKIIKFH